MGILLSLTFADSSTMQSRKRKRKEISCYLLAEVKFTILTLDVVSLSRHQKSEQPSLGRKLEICEEKERQRVQRGSSESILAVQECCAVLTSCQRISAQWFSAWLRGPRAHRALLAVRPEQCARLDRVTIVKKAAKVQWLHSACFTFTLSPLPTYPHRTKQKHTLCHLVHFTKSTYRTSINTKVFTCEIPGTKLE